MKTQMILAGLLVANTASALTPAEEAYFTTGPAELEVLDSAQAPPADFSVIMEGLETKSFSFREATEADTERLEAADPGLATGEPEIDRVINIGRVMWTIAERNRPVVGYDEHQAIIVPEGTRRWDELEGWREPVTRTYSVTYRNLYGATVVRFVYQVQFTPGGGLDGRGSYISGATIVPVDLDVAWGYTFDATVRTEDVVNAGTRANPVAALKLGLHWSVDTVLKHSQSSASYYLQGNGRFREL